jgi:[ribosomal protein S5]-alanine N-acetyltransferase
MAEVFDFSYFPTLETSQFRLRQITHDDADALIALYNHPDVVKYLIIEPPCDNRQRAIEMIDWMSSWFQQRGGLRWAITFREQDTLIGTCGFHFYSAEHRRVDIGYDLNAAYWGRGYITEIARAIVGWCFENLDLHRVQADCTEGNIGSERVLEKVGFKLEGIWRENTFEHGRFVNIKQYGLLRHEFMADTRPT